MGLLDELKSGLGGLLSGEVGSSSLLDSIAGLINRGELNGLIRQFRENGLGDVFSSWVGTGENQPVSGEQLRGVLGEETIKKFADQSGVSMEEVSSGLADLLPRFIDKLTPDGKIPEEGLLPQGLEGLKKLFS